MTEAPDRRSRDQIALVSHAAGFAIRCHDGHKRKGASAQPFILHVAEVSDDRSLPEAERHRLQIETIAEKSEAARMLRLADKISGLRELAEDPPPGWDAARRREWLRFATEAAAVHSIDEISAETAG